MKKYNSRAAARLAACRMRLHLTQKEVAELLRNTNSSISDFERGKRKPSLDLLAESCNIFGKDPGELLSDDSSRVTLSLDRRECRVIERFRNSPEPGRQMIETLQNFIQYCMTKGIRSML
ncbi:MAG: helix-turn-helix transcriptional regulator [Solobacterium sp.]|nr:helix-turn-helix transcriptional regulator [Solobacterium sp.]